MTYEYGGKPISIMHIPPFFLCCINYTQFELLTILYFIIIIIIKLLNENDWGGSQPAYFRQLMEERASRRGICGLYCCSVFCSSSFCLQLSISLRLRPQASYTDVGASKHDVIFFLYLCFYFALFHLIRFHFSL